MLTPYTIEKFGGLNVLVDPFEVGATGATSLLNVDLDVRGALRCRDGLTSWSTYVQPSPATNPFFYLWETPHGHRLATAASTTYALDAGGALVTSNAFDPGSKQGYANFSTATANYTFISRNAATPKRYDGSAFSAPAFTGTSPTGNYLAVTPVSNRLVNYGISANPYRVLFSDPGDPLTFQADNFVDLGYGDGTPVASAVWQSQLFIFAAGRVYIFYGESTDADGGAVFNYRTIDTPYKDVLTARPVAGPDGVYMLTGTGLYRTQGGAFELVSDALNPLLQGKQSPSFTLSDTGTEGECVNSRLFWAVRSSTTFDYLLVYDLVTQAWLIWQAAIFGLGVQRHNQAPRLFVSLRTGTSPNPIAYFNPAATTDNGSAISWSWTSGRYSLSDPGNVVITRESSVVGSGTVQLDVTTDLYGALTGTATTLGTAPATAEGWPFGDQEGTWFQHTLSGSGAASVSRLSHYVRFVKPAGVR